MIVIKYFIDKTDKSEYNPGDVYPRGDLEASESRIADLTAKGYISEDPVEVPEAKALDPVEEKKPAKKTASRRRKGERS